MRIHDKGTASIFSLTLDMALTNGDGEEANELLRLWLDAKPFNHAIDTIRLCFETPPFFIGTITTSEKLKFTAKIAHNNHPIRGLFVVFNEQLRFFNGAYLLPFEVTDAPTLLRSKGDSRRLGRDLLSRQDALRFELPNRVKIVEWDKTQSQPIVPRRFIEDAIQTKKLISSEQLPGRGPWTSEFFAKRYDITSRAVTKHLEAWASRPRTVDYMPFVKVGGRWVIEERTIAQAYDDALRLDHREKKP